MAFQYGDFLSITSNGIAYTTASAAADYPAVGDVESGVSYGSGDYTGTFTVPSAATVTSGTGYGASGTEFTGTFQQSYSTMATGMFSHTCTISRRTVDSTDVNTGHTTYTWANFATGVRCRFDEMTEQEVLGRSLTIVENPRLFMLIGQDVTERDRITNVLDRGGNTIHAGPFEIVGISKPSNHHVEAKLEKV